MADNVFRVRVAAPPVRGKANQELIALLSRVLGISKDKIDIVRGHTVRDKVLAIDGLSYQDVMNRLIPG